jgi:hypothetical protein
MRNLEQIRARNALNFAKQGTVPGENGGEVIKKVGPLIQNHGLLATAAYSFTEKGGWQRVFDAIAQHLADEDIAIVSSDVNDRQALMEFLTQTGTTSETLKLATAETMAWLIYACRFVKKA